MVRRLNGMFASVIHDRRRDILFGARDRSGIKPLYYTLSTSQFAFAFELKALLGLPWVPRDAGRGEPVPLSESPVRPWRVVHHSRHSPSFAGSVVQIRSRQEAARIGD